MRSSALKQRVHAGSSRMLLERNTGHILQAFQGYSRSLSTGA